MLWLSSARCFCFGLEFEFLEDLWNRKSLASVSAVQLGVFCALVGSFSGWAVFFSEDEDQKQQSGSISSMDWIVKYELFWLVKREQFSLHFGWVDRKSDLRLLSILLSYLRFSGMCCPVFARVLHQHFHSTPDQSGAAEAVWRVLPFVFFRKEK